MIELGQHWEFVAAAYLGTGALVGAVIAWIALDAARTRERVAALERDHPRRKAGP